MTDERSDDDLIRALSDDLEPVKPILPLRGMVAALLGLWFAVAVVGIAALGLAPGFFEMLLMARGTAAVFAGLVVAGVSGVVAALALGVPGREGVVRLAFLAAALGMAVAAGTGTLLLVESPLVEAPISASHHFACLMTAGVVGTVPALLLVWFAGRSAPHRPLVLVLAAAAGMAALGAATAQATCPYNDVRHLMVGHILAPVLLSVVLSLPLLIALRRFRS